MPDNTSRAINSDALYTKSKVYIGRAIERKGTGNHDEYQLWASFALELLGKAALARKHPSLVVDPTHWQSLFAAANIKVTTDVKTISAKTLFERLTHLDHRFDKKICRFCLEISERRNAELHSADLPFQNMRLDAWEARYWHACDVILHQMETSLEKWLGAADAEAPRLLLDEASKAIVSAVKLRIEAAKEAFETSKKTERDTARQREPLYQAAHFKDSYDEIWMVNCPACDCRALMTGNQTSEDINEMHDDFAIWEIVDREFFGEEFHCPTCNLMLTGSEEIDAAGLNHIYEDQQEREMEYEPDYGND